MARWQPGAQARLQEAALALFAEHGFEATTVAEIAARAGLTKRSFFHHFADKREVLFSGDAEAYDVIEHAIGSADAPSGPLHAATAGLRSAAESLFEPHRAAAAQRSLLVAASRELQERELLKRARLAEIVAAALRHRGTPAGPAAVAAWTAVAVFHTARDRWTTTGDESTLAHHIDEVLGEFLDTAGIDRL